MRQLKILPRQVYYLNNSLACFLSMSALLPSATELCTVVRCPLCSNNVAARSGGCSSLGPTHACHSQCVLRSEMHVCMPNTQHVLRAALTRNEPSGTAHTATGNGTAISSAGPGGAALLGRRALKAAAPPTGNIAASLNPPGPNCTERVFEPNGKGGGAISQVSQLQCHH